jgi:hypothetical protein
MVKTSIAMLDKEHHIHLIPSERILMLSIEHSNLKKVEANQFEIECFLKLSIEGFPHPLEDVIRFTFISPRKVEPEIMAEVTLVQNHIIKYIFDNDLYGERGIADIDDPVSKESGITISAEIKNAMLWSKLLKDVLEKHGALPDSVEFVK